MAAPLPARVDPSREEQLEVQLGHTCNNVCTFCESGLLTKLKLARPVAVDPVLETLDAARARGIRRLTILGGEPTIHIGFFEVLDGAIARGFDDITIFTNGVRGPHDRFWEEVLGRGRFTWRFSIQGGDAVTHDAVVQRPGAFAKIETAMGRLAARGEVITVNMCVTAQSAPSLPLYPALLARYGVTQFHVDMVRPENAGPRGEAEILAILPRYTELARHLSGMLGEFRRVAPWIEANIGNLPWCVLPEGRDVIHHGGEPTLTLTTGEGGELGTVLDKYTMQRRGMVHPEGCARCVLRPRCRGVPTMYLARWGDLELVPVVEAGAADPALAARPRLPRAPSPRLLRVTARLLRTDTVALGFAAERARALPDGDGVLVPWTHDGGPGVEWVLRDGEAGVSIEVRALGIPVEHAQRLRGAVARALAIEEAA